MEKFSSKKMSLALLALFLFTAGVAIFTLPGQFNTSYGIGATIGFVIALSVKAFIAAFLVWLVSNKQIAIVLSFNIALVAFIVNQVSADIISRLL